MVAKKTKATSYASKPKKNKTKKDIDKGKNTNEKKKNTTGSNVSFGKLSIEIIKPSSRNALADTDSSSAVELEEIPKTGEELLKWTREHMSFTSTRSNEESEMALEEELEIPLPPTSKKPKSEKIEKVPKKTKKQGGKKKKKPTDGKVSEEEFLDLTAPGPLEDEVMFQWRLKKEEQRRLSRKKNRSEVTFLEPTTDVVKVSSTSILKDGRRKTTKYTLAAKKEAQRLLEKEIEERKRREEIFQQDLMKHEQDEAEDIIREQKNATTLRRIRRFHKEQVDRIWELFRKAEVEHYRTCEKIPLVTKCDQLTFFVKQWEESVGEMSLEDLGSVCGVNLELLKRLDELIFYTSPNEQEKMEQWLWSSGILRSTQEEMLNRTTYNILSDIYKNLKIENLEYGEFQSKNDSFTLSIWLKLDWPMSMPNPKKPPGSETEVHLSEVDVICIFPPSLPCDQKALVCLYMPYDHVSDSCATFQPPPKPDYLTKDLSESNYEDKLRKLKYSYESHLRSEYVEKVESYKEKHPDDKYPFPFVLPEIELNEDIPRVAPQNLDPTPTEYVDLADDLLYDNCLKGMYVEAALDEVSLRQYQLIGGLYDIQLVYHPPQPQPLVKFHMTLRTVKQPKKLEKVPFFMEFHPPPLPWLEEGPKSANSSTKSFKSMRSKRLTAKYGSKTESRKGGGFDPDEVQKYKDALEQWEVNLRLEKEKMILVSLGLPEGVIYLENPTVCLWNEVSRSWSAGDIYEVDHEHSERRITFRSSKFGLFGLAVRRYQNYPYKSWDIRPNEDDSISIVLEGSKVTVNLTIQESDIKVVDFEYRISDYLVGKEGLNCLKSKSSTLPRFIEMMRRSGLDMFPDHDANCYYTATMEKHWPTAYVAYHAMAQSAIRYNFSRSKWNSESGRRSIVLRLREYDPTDDTAILRTFDLVQVTPLRAQVLVCTEDDENFSDEATILYKFQPNLQYLLKSMSKVTNRAKINEFSPATIHTLTEFLTRTRIFSFS